MIGRGHLLGGPVEIAGAGWSAPKYFETPGDGQLCVWIEHLTERATSSRCGPVAQTASGKGTVYIESFSEGMGTSRPRETELTGSVAPGVASLQVSFGDLGARLSLCQTSKAGEPVWQKFGYRPLTSYGRWLMTPRPGA